MVVTRWWRQRVYYEAFAGELKHATDFCVPIVPCEGGDAVNSPNHLNGIALRRKTAPACSAAGKTAESHSRKPVTGPPEVFLRLVNSAWYALPVPVRISASACCFHEEDHRRRWQHSQAKAPGGYGSSESFCAQTRSGWRLRSGWHRSGEWSKPHAFLERRADARSSPARGKARTAGSRNSQTVAIFRGPGGRSRGLAG